MLAGVGTNETALGGLARQAEKHGAAGLRRHALLQQAAAGRSHRPLHTVCDASGLPAMLYDIPGRTGLKIATESLLRLAEHDQIVAVKDAAGDLFAGSWVMARTEPRVLLRRRTPSTSPGSPTARPASSASSATWPARYAAMVAAVDSGDLATARAIHRALLPRFAA